MKLPRAPNTYADGSNHGYPGFLCIRSTQYGITINTVMVVTPGIKTLGEGS